jgi:hypothetical protein
MVLASGLAPAIHCEWVMSLTSQQRRHHIDIMPQLWFQATAKHVCRAANPASSSHVSACNTV